MANDTEPHDLEVVTVSNRARGDAAGRPAVPGDRPASTTHSARPGGLGPFVTFIEYERPDGLISRWESRRERKGWSQDRRVPGTWWAPMARGWWIGVLFAIGATLFALGAAPGYADAVGLRADSTTFFVGSLFFTAAAFLQYRESVDAAPEGRPRGLRRIFAARPGQLDWWASAIQLAGTLFFNLSTGVALQDGLSAQAERHHVWRPDAIGSVCFLVASSLAWFEVCGGWTAWRPRDLSWWITGLNLAGSIAFGASAIAAFVVPATGQLRNAELSNLGTFVGAVCFLAGAVLLLPERTAGAVPDRAPPTDVHTADQGRHERTPAGSAE